MLDGALVPPSSPCQIRFFDQASNRLFPGWNGGAYRSDRTHCELSLLDRVHSNVTVPFEPNELAWFDYQYVAGPAVYGGLLSKHFGHFLLESTARLWWPLREKFDGPIVFQSPGRAGKIPAFASRFFELMGVADRVIVTAQHGYRFDSLIVPERSFAIQKYWHDDFRMPFLTAGAAAERSWRPMSEAVDAVGVYLSRTQLDYRRSLGEEELETAFSRNGFAVVHPEALPLEEQIVLCRKHVTVAGIQGSALHTMLFSDSPKQAIYICRDYDVNPNYFMIDAMMGNHATHIYNGVAEDAAFARSDRALIAEQYGEDVSLDVKKIYRALAKPDVVKSGWRNIAS